MTLKVIRQLHKNTMKLSNTSSSLSRINANTDQALMNMTYETDPKKDIAICLELITEMIDKYRKIIGR